ncbi:MAG: hypothetical protein OEY22_01765 [Candidatus Bathyarchaeota archaeon]|nr:hypothetical protein [Candidatus Bathyarchaeota archaeon]MDH5787450.1 hypothetical protein [Candidatus Bathyarchaeota archaeon]
MVKFQWPIRRGKATSSTLAGDQTSQSLKLEAGLTTIKGTEDLASRIRFTDDFFTNILNEFHAQLKQLLQKKDKTPEDIELISMLNAYLVNFESYRAVKKSGMAWSIAGQDHDMSKRYMAFETYFTRNWRNPDEVKKILRFAMYLLDISFKENHVEPAPSIIVQSLPSGPRIDLGGKEEKITQED